MAHDPLSGPALYADVVTYAGFGDHRTGTPAEAATTDWLSDQLRTAGYQLERQPFGLPVFDLEDASVEVGGRRLNAFPLWTPQAGEAVGPLSLEARPGAFIMLGNCGSAGLHDPKYDFNDAAIPYGMSYWAQLVETALAA